MKSISPNGWIWAIFFGVASVVGLVSRDAVGQGIIISSSGPVNRSMGGAAVAAPLESIGALRWNPGSISGLRTSELGFGIDLLWPNAEVESSIAGLASGKTESDSGVSPIPAIGWVHKLSDSPWTFGLGVFGVAGFRTNYAAGLTNPLFLPQSNTPGVPGGLGRVYSSAEYVEVTPTASVAVTEFLSFGVSPVIALGEVFLDPFVTTAPNDADGSGAPRYPVGTGSYTCWGGGVQAGVYCILSDDWRAGAAIKSPDWMEPFEYHHQDEAGLPLRGRLHLDLPMIVSGGVAFDGWENAVAALDVRYFDYENTAGFDVSGFGPDGALRGLGWESVWSLSAGIQYQLTDAISVRTGYTFNENPIPDAQAMVAIAAPLVYEHQWSVGASIKISPNATISAAYGYYFENDITGPIVTPLGAVPGSSVTTRLDAHIADLGVTVAY